MSPVSQISQFVVSSDGAKIYADAVGDLTKPSIVFIHGLSLSGVVYDNIFTNDSYSSQFYLVRYDMRGHGRSAKPDTIDGYSSKLYADDFAAVIKAFNLKRPVLVGWSMGATVLTDVAEHLPFDTLSGAVYLTALPYIGPVMERVGTSTILGFLPGLLCEDSVSTSAKTAQEFTDSLFVDPSSVSWELRTLWVGLSARQTPKDRKHILTRPQDPTKLRELGVQGLPLLIINGTSDNQVIGHEVVEEMKPYYKDLEVIVISNGGSHAVHYENVDEVMDAVAKFTHRVQGASA